MVVGISPGTRHEARLTKCKASTPANRILLFANLVLHEHLHLFKLAADTRIELTTGLIKDHAGHHTNMSLGDRHHRPNQFKIRLRSCPRPT